MTVVRAFPWPTPTFPLSGVPVDHVQSSAGTWSTPTLHVYIPVLGHKTSVWGSHPVN